MRVASLKSKWLFNFSSSHVGGGLKRLEETAKYFDKRNGAVFLVHRCVLHDFSKYSRCNRFIGIKQSKMRRLVADGQYIHGIVNEVGIPDIYFSYGIPVFYHVGRINWLHVSNALTLITNVHEIPLIRRLEHRVLGRRIVRSLRHVQIASAESEFSLDLLRKAKKNNNARCVYLVLRNGCENGLLCTGNKRQSNNATENYAVTIGTAPYKRLDLALTIFHILQKTHPNMKKLKIIGDKKLIPKQVRNNRAVEAVGLISNREALYDALRNAKYYISASLIENSSNAALEGLLLSPNTILSDIPPHREICRAFSIEEFRVPNDGNYIMVDSNHKKNNIKLPSWNDVLSEMVDIAEDYMLTNFPSPKLS